MVVISTTSPAASTAATSVVPGTSPAGTVLRGGAPAGAGLDVWRHEPAIDPRLLALPNVVMTPHMGSATYEGRVASGERVIANIRMWADGHRPPDQVLDGWA